MTLQQRYAAAMHRMQSATAFDIARQLDGSVPPSAERLMKHLRTGLNSAMASQEGLARLLIEKGLFTMEEYLAAMTPAAEREADARVDEVKKKYSLAESVRFG